MNDSIESVQKAEIIQALSDPNVEFIIEEPKPPIPVKAISLLEAVEKNLMPKITSLLSEKADVNQSNKEGDTPLHLAVRKGNLELITLLIEHKANINARIGGGTYNYRNTPLHAAIILEREDPTIGIAFNEKETQEYYNTYRYKVVSTLLKAKADVAVTDSGGFTPLSYAVREESLELVSLLKEFGATENSPDTPLILAVRKYYSEGTPFVFKGCKGPHKSEILRNREKIIQALLEPSAINLLSHSHPRHTALHEATEMGAIDLIPLLLANGADLTVGDEYGVRPLALAIKKNQIAAALSLIEGKADVNALFKTRWGNYTNSYLKQAVEEGSVEFVKLLLENKAEMEAIHDSNKTTALHFAAEKHDLTCMKVLLAAKASVNSVSVNGTTPLFMAITQQYYISRYYDKVEKISKEKADRQTQCVTALLQAKAEVNTVDGEKYSPLHVASLKGLIHLIPILHKAGAKQLPNKDGDTPLMVAIRQRSYECVQALLEAKASLNTTDSFKRTPLHLAAHEGMVDCISLFCAKGAKVNYTDDIKAYEKTPLYEAIHAIPRDPEAHHYATVYRLLELKASVNYTDSYGGTPLHQAAGRSAEGLIRVLIARDKGLLNAVDNHKKTPLHRAIEYDQAACVRILIESKADMRINFEIKGDADIECSGKTLIEYAAAMNAEKSIPLLLKYGEKTEQPLVINDNTPGMITVPIMISVRMGKLNSFRSLLKSKANLRVHTSKGYNLLQIAVLRRRTEMISWLLDQKFDVNEKNKLGDDSPLILAAHEGFFEGARMLLDARAKVNDIDSKGNTALHWAAKQGRYQLFPVLTAYGADLHLLNAEGKSPLALCKNKETIEFLQINETVKPIFDPVYLQVLSDYIEEIYLKDSFSDHLLTKHYYVMPKLRSIIANAVDLAFNTIFIPVLAKLKHQRSLLNFSPARDEEADKKDQEQWIKILKDTLVDYLHNDYLDTRSEATFWQPYIEVLLFQLECVKKDTEVLSMDLIDKELLTLLPGVLWYKCFEYYPGVGSKLPELFDGNTVLFITPPAGGAGSFSGLPGFVEALPDLVELSDSPKAYLKSLDKNSSFNYYKVIDRHERLIGNRFQWLIKHLNKQYHIAKNGKVLEERYKSYTPGA